MRTLTALFAASFIGGCVIYDNDCPSQDYGGLEGDDGHDRPDFNDDTGSNGGGDEEPAAAFFLDPDTAIPGDVFIASLTSDQAINFDAVVDVDFLSDDITLCTMQSRADELLLTIGVADVAAFGTVDLIIAFEDGENVYVEAALEIVRPDSNDGSGGGGTGGGGTGGGGTGGSGDGGICG